MNRTKIAASLVPLMVLLASFNPSALPAYIVGAPEGLDKMTTNADLICKARVISYTTITNEAFQPLQGFETRATRLEIISVLKGNSSTRFVSFQHYASNPQDQMGRMYAPQHYEPENRQSYLLFAVKTDREGEFRQIRFSHTGKEDEGVMRTLDDRPLPNVSIKDAHWQEVNLLLNSTNTTNQIYAIRQLSSMSKGCVNDWGHTDDFQRDAVLKALSPIIADTNDTVAIGALECFQSGQDCSSQIAPYADTLIQTANDSRSIPRRIAAITALAGTKFSSVSNALSRWLADPSEDVRLQAVLLLPDFPGEFSETALRERADDLSSKVRAGVADAIGNGKIESLLPTLKKLLLDPVGLTSPVPPLTTAELQSGGRVWGNNNGDVHTAAGYALLKFDVRQVGDILKANLNDEGFRPSYLCKLAESDTGPWLTNLVGFLEARRIRIQIQADESRAEPKAAYFQALMTLSGTAYNCWDIIYKYLHDLPTADFADGKLNRCLTALESAGTSGSREPTMLYELYRMKGLNKRAAKFRSEHDNQSVGYEISPNYDRIDARFPNPPAISEP